MKKPHSTHRISKAVRKKAKKLVNKLPKALKIGIYEPLLGTSIDVAAKEAIAQAKKQRCPVKFNFNGTKLIATAKKSPTTLVWEFNQILAQQSDRHTHSKAGLKAAAERAQQIKDGQQRLNAAFTTLPALLAQPEPQRLDSLVRWLRDNQSDMDDCEVEYSIAKLLTDLESAGYVDNAHVGKKPECFTRQAIGEWIVGQVINCLKHGMGPHQIIHRFADDYFGWTDEQEAKALQNLAATR